MKKLTFLFVLLVVISIGFQIYFDMQLRKTNTYFLGEIQGTKYLIKTEFPSQWDSFIKEMKIDVPEDTSKK